MSARKVSSLRWHIAALIFLSIVINYINRQTLSVAAPLIKYDLHLSQIQFGYILQAFLLAYTVMYIISGFLVDFLGTRKSLTLFVGSWSVANVIPVFARSAASLLCFASLLGIAEPGNFNSAARATSEWFPPKERAFINGLVNAAGAIGAVISIPLTAWVAFHYGWHYAFVVTGALGLIWLVPWLLLYHLPEQHPLITDAELAYIHSGPAILRQGEMLTIAQLLRKPDIWGLMLARFFSDPIWWFYLFWLPSFLQEQRSFTLSQVALFGWMPYLSSGAGALLGGCISDRLIGRAGSPVRARMTAMAICTLVMPISLFVPRLNSTGSMITVLCAVIFFYMAWKVNLVTITNDVYPTRYVGTVNGMLMVGSGAGGFLFQGVTATLVQHFSYSSVFVVMGFLPPVAFVICYLLLHKANLMRPVCQNSMNHDALEAS